MILIGYQNDQSDEVMKILSHDKANGLPEKYPHIRFRWFSTSFPMFMPKSFILEDSKYYTTGIEMIPLVFISIRLCSII